MAIIDDDESFGRSVRRWMHAADFSAAIYRSAEEFLADPDKGRFDCLIVDIQLGGMSGLELRRRLAVKGIRIPIIFVTAYDDPAGIAEAERAGCAFLRKTADGVHLLQAIRGACGSVISSETVIH